MTMLTDLARNNNPLAIGLLEMEKTTVDRVNEIFTDTTEGIISDLTFLDTAGDISKPYREFRDRYSRVVSHEYSGRADLDFPDVEEWDTEGRYAPRQYVIPGGKWELARIEARSLPSIADELAEMQRAILVEAAQIRIDEFTKNLISGSGGLGGISPLLGGAGKTLFNNSITQLRAPDKPAFSNIKTDAEIAGGGAINWATPAIKDAFELAKAAEDYFMAADTDGRYGFTDPETVRSGLYFVTTSKNWRQAFRDLQARPTLATNTAAPASDAGNYGNDYQNMIQVRYAKNHEGKPWENWVRAFYVGPRPQDRPILMAPDLGARAYQLGGSDTLHLMVGWLLSWYALGWRHESGVLFKEA